MRAHGGDGEQRADVAMQVARSATTAMVAATSMVMAVDPTQVRAPRSLILSLNQRAANSVSL